MNYPKRIRALRTALRREKLDALVVLTRESDSKNVGYLCGFGGTMGLLAITARAGLLVVDGRYTERAAGEASGVRVVSVPLPAREGNMIPYLRTALEALGLGARPRVGFEGARVSVLMARAWEETFRMKFVPTELMVERLRGVKSAEEIRALADAARRTARAFESMAPRVKAGMREREVQDLIESALKKFGARSPSFETIVASGPHSAMPHHATGERRLRAGEPVVMDFGGVFRGGYCSDMTRTIFVHGKKPEPELARIYRIVHEANARAARAAKPGMLWREYDAIARAYIKECGYGEYFAHGLGHSLGLEVHDPYDYREAPLSAGVVLTDEPGIYVPGVGGVRIEDTLVMTKKGARRLAPPAPAL